MSVNLNATGVANCDQCGRLIVEGETFVTLQRKLEVISQRTLHVIEEEVVATVCYDCQRGVDVARLRKVLEFSKVWNG